MRQSRLITPPIHIGRRIGPATYNYYFSIRSDIDGPVSFEWRCSSHRLRQQVGHPSTFQSHLTRELEAHAFISRFSGFGSVKHDRRACAYLQVIDGHRRFLATPVPR
jgi:hypothetical protein